MAHLHHLSCDTSHGRSTTVSLETYPFYFLNSFVKGGLIQTVPWLKNKTYFKIDFVVHHEIAEVVTKYEYINFQELCKIIHLPSSSAEKDLIPVEPKK